MSITIGIRLSTPSFLELPSDFLEFRSIERFFVEFHFEEVRFSPSTTFINRFFLLPLQYELTRWQLTRSLLHACRLNTNWELFSVSVSAERKVVNKNRINVLSVEERKKMFWESYRMSRSPLIKSSTGSRAFSYYAKTWAFRSYQTLLMNSLLIPILIPLSMIEKALQWSW